MIHPTQSESMPHVCFFHEIDRTMLKWVGGKGANLGELTQQGFPVPPGFCVTTRAYREFIQSGSTTLQETLCMLETLDVKRTEDVRVLGQSIREALSALPIPTGLEDAIVHAWEASGATDAYAVRSSATAEDLPDASFAGQQDTYLNIVGRTELLHAVRSCWASLFTDRAIVYRAQNGFKHDEVALSVVIQKMIQPSISGIMFTVDPLSQNRNILSIDAGFGLGEALVSGRVSADLYKIRKHTWTLEETKTGDKAIAIRSIEGGGTFEEELSEEMRHQQVMTMEQLQELARLGTCIEQHYGSLQDIEWCIEDEILYIVQSRPITSLYPSLQDLPTDPSLHVYACFNHFQVMLDPIKPLGRSILSLLLPIGKSGQVSTHSRMITSAGSRIFIDFTEMMRHPIPNQHLPKLLRIADTLLASSLQEVTQRKRFQSEMRDAFKFPMYPVVRKVLAPVLRRILAYLCIRKPEGRLAELEHFIHDSANQFESTVEQMDDPLAQLHCLKQTLGTLFLEKLIPTFVPVVATGLISAKLLARLAGLTLDDPKIFHLMRGLEGNVTTEMDLHVADIADVARNYPEVSKALHDNPTQSVLAELRICEGGPVFLDAFQHFLDLYGMRGPSEIDITRERWEEDPTSLLQSIVGNLTRETSGEHRVNHQNMAAQSEHAATELLGLLNQGPLGWLKASIGRRLIRVHRNLMGGREHPKYMMIRFIGVAKKVILQHGERMYTQGTLSHPKDIYYLELDECESILKGQTGTRQGSSWKQLIQERKDEHKRHSMYTPPRILTSEGEIVLSQHNRDDVPQGALVGSSASQGIIEGKARVILDPKDAILSEGEILVAPFTDPGWTPLFIHASGLVMEVGGLMTHGSVVAREYGIPAVVCVPNATQHIQTGQYIRVHGDGGYVEILSQGPTHPETEHVAGHAS